MKKHFKIFIGLIALLSINFIGCKTSNDAKPLNQQEVQIVALKNFFATTARVSINQIQYNGKTDIFTVNNTGKISRTDLLKFYSVSQQKDHILR